MPQPGENVLLRIFLDTYQHWHHVPTYEALVDLARRHRMAGATVLEGIQGFGQSGRLLKEKGWRLGADREVIVEIVDTRENIDAFIAAADPLLEGALVTVERARVVVLKAGP